jgi:hypothetical protein
MTINEQRVLEALRAQVEYENSLGWGCVYLDNAASCLSDLSNRQFAGYLSALEAKELYRPEGDDCFGYVRLD